MKEIPLTKGMYALVDDEDFEALSGFRWKYTNRGYAARNYVENGVNKTSLMHRIVLNAPKGTSVDHIDGNRLNNQKENLRIVSNRQNSWNQGPGKLNKSGYKGVHWNKHNKKWVASIKHNYRQIHLGYFETKEDAARMYNFWAVDIFGEYARLNIIEEAV